MELKQKDQQETGQEIARGHKAKNNSSKAKYFTVFLQEEKRLKIDLVIVDVALAARPRSRRSPAHFFSK